MQSNHSNAKHVPRILGGIGDRIKALLLRPRRYCGRDMLIRKLQKFTTQNGSLNAAIEERHNRKIVNFSIAASNFSIEASIFSFAVSIFFIFLRAFNPNLT